MEEILNVIRTYGADTVVLAILINVLTGFLKIPVKKLSDKGGYDINKYITLIPVALGFVLASLANGLVFESGVFWSERVPVLAVSASSLSLSIYAVLEKFFVKTTKEIGEDIKQSDEAPCEKVEQTSCEKIILGKKESDDESKA